MDASMLRQIWSAIERTQAGVLLRLNDTELACELLGQIENRRPLSDEESKVASAYLRSKVLLIRDLAEARLVQA